MKQDIEKNNIFPKSIIEFTSHYHFQKFSKTKSFVFYFIILLIISSVIFCSWIKIDVTVDCSGVIRSLKNKTEVRLSASGMLDELYISENKFVKKDENKGIFLVYIKNFDGSIHKIMKLILQ